MGFVVWFNLDWIIGKRFRQNFNDCRITNKSYPKIFCYYWLQFKVEGGRGGREREAHEGHEIQFRNFVDWDNYDTLACSSWHKVFLQNIFYHLQYGHNKLGVLKGRD